MAIRILPLVVILVAASGCTSFRPSFLWSDCPGGRDAVSRATACMAAATYEIAADKVEAARRDRPIEIGDDEVYEDGESEEDDADPAAEE